MSNRLVSDSSPAVIGAKRIVIGAALVAVGYLVALLVSSSAVVLGGRGNNASDATAAASVSAHGGSAEEAGPMQSTSGDFDYFPDHFVNQAHEVAARPPTF